MSIPHLLFMENGYKPSPQRTPGSFGWTSVAYDSVDVCLKYHRPIMTKACPPKPSQKSLHPKLEPVLPRVSKSGVLRTNPLWLELVEELKNTFICSSLAVLCSTQSDMFLRKEYLRNKLKNKVNSISYLAGTVFPSL